MARVVYFEIQVDDFKRSQEFYRKVFGWNFSKIEAPFEYYMVDTGHQGEESINGGMLNRHQPIAKNNGVSGYVCAVYVDSIDQTLEKIKKHGGVVTMGKTQ